MRSVFLDANCYLSFYKLTSVDLEELKKLVEMVKNGRLRLYVSQHLQDEVRRNRERVIADSIGAAKNRNPTGGYPQLLRNYAGFKEVNQAGREFSERLNELIAVVEADARANQLHADALISSLFAAGKQMDSAAVNARALDRVQRGNPPGKRDSLGDAIHWEVLLETQPWGEDLDLVTDDQDFRSPLDDGVSEFLATEWRALKCSEVHLYRDLAKFFATNFPEIKVAEDVIRVQAVRSLTTSGSFTSTHAAIADLERIGTYTAEQAGELIQAAVDNTQVRWLLGDDDVVAFYTRLLAAHDQVPDALTAATVHALITGLAPGWYDHVGPSGAEWTGERWEPF